jgi:hypothetical protein
MVNARGTVGWKQEAGGERGESEVRFGAVRDGPKKLGYLQFNFDFVNKSSI